MVANFPITINVLKLCLKYLSCHQRVNIENIFTVNYIKVLSNFTFSELVKTLHKNKITYKNYNT